MSGAMCKLVKIMFLFNTFKIKKGKICILSVRSYSKLSKL